MNPKNKKQIDEGFDDSWEVNLKDKISAMTEEEFEEWKKKENLD